MHGSSPQTNSLTTGVFYDHGRERARGSLAHHGRREAKGKRLARIRQEPLADCVAIWQSYQICMENQRMDPNLKATYDARARIVKALAHPTRLLIVDQL
jgi:hypothetical protein